MIVFFSFSVLKFYRQSYSLNVQISRKRRILAPTYSVIPPEILSHEFTRSQWVTNTCTSWTTMVSSHWPLWDISLASMTSRGRYRLPPTSLRVLLPLASYCWLTPVRELLDRVVPSLIGLFVFLGHWSLNSFISRLSQWPLNVLSMTSSRVMNFKDRGNSIPTCTSYNNNWQKIVSVNLSHLPPPPTLTRPCYAALHARYLKE